MKRKCAIALICMACALGLSGADKKDKAAVKDSPAAKASPGKAPASNPPSRFGIKINADPTKPEKASHGPFGLGLMVGDPTGIAAKLWFDKKSAVDLGLGWDFLSSTLSAESAYLFHIRDFILIGDADLPLFAGIGAFYKQNGAQAGNQGSPVTAGVRIPLGACYTFSAIPLEVSLELAPGMKLYEGTEPYFQGALALRYYF